MLLAGNNRPSVQLRQPAAGCDMLLLMQLTLASISARAGSKDAYDAPVRDYLKRSASVAHCAAESFRTEKAFLDWLARQRGRTEPAVLLLDGSGPPMSSEALAKWLGAHRNDGTQHVVFAIGPADGWSEQTRSQASRRGTLLSLSPMTLAHQLARLVMAEQIYRACTILTGHPYHSGH